MDLLSVINHLITFLLVLYGDPILPRKIVQVIVDLMNNFISIVLLPSLKADILEALKNENISKLSLNNINRCFETHCNIFDYVSTESKRFKLLRKKGFVDPQEFEIGITFKEELVGNDMLMVSQVMRGIFVPMRNTLKLFLEIPGLFTQIMNYMKQLSEEKQIITNILQSDLWLTKYRENCRDSIILPLFIFYDDLEVGNPLGSHAGINKFGAVYAQIACLPPNIASKLNSIFFSTLVRVSDKKKSSNEKVFAKLIEELNVLLREGIQIVINSVEHVVKFQFTLVLGDNLGLNGILGFTESFKANYSCRICKVTSEQSSSMTEEDESLLRTRENYEDDVKNRGVSKSGIKESCVFHKVQNFHVTENLTIDMMHDILEGVCVYVMRAIIYTFVFETKYFTLQLLNNRIQNFEYGFTENGNKPPIIAMHRIKKKLNLKISASEMLCLVRYFGLIIGDLIPENDESWKLYRFLRQIIDIVTSPRIIRADAKAMKDFVNNLNSLYIKLYGKLKPKFHNMVHYPRILLANGPCINFWCMRFESRHRQLKSNALSTSCSKNLLLTIATKQVLNTCQMIHSGGFKNSIDFGSRDDNIGTKEYSKKVSNNSECECYKEVEINGIMFKIGMFIVTDISQTEKEFGKIIKIMKVEEEVFFVVNIFEEITFDFHYHAYIVQKISILDKIFSYKDLPAVTPALYIKKGETHFIAVRYAL